jgi:hypothetical protein
MDAEIMYESAVELLDQLELIEVLAQNAVAVYANSVKLDEIWEAMLALELALTELTEMKRNFEHG